MPQSAEEIYAAVRARVDHDGRLKAPPIATWDVFPWEAVDGVIVPKRLAPPADEPLRGGEGDKPCSGCGDSVDARTIWRDDALRVVHLGSPTGLPIVVLIETVEHVDYPDLDDDLAARLGVLSVRLTRVIEAMPHIGRCHVDRWGDGGSHLHVWFFARPARQAAILGSYAVEWDEILPPTPEDVWRADLSAVAAALASYGGEALV